MKTAEGMEQPAKNWQIAELDRRLTAHERFAERVEAKLDLLIENQVTNNQLNQQILNIEKSFTSEIEKVHLKYGPIAKNITKFTWAIVMIGLAQGAVILFNLLSK